MPTTFVLAGYEGVPMISLMERRKKEFDAVLEQLTVVSANRKGTLLSTAIRDTLLAADSDYRLSLTPKNCVQYTCPKNPLAMLCHPAAEAHFSILGGFMWLVPIKAHDPYTYVPPQVDPLHRYNMLRFLPYTAFDPTEEQYTSRGLAAPRGGKSRSYGLAGWPSDRARLVIQRVYRDLTAMPSCATRHELLPLVTAAYKFWPVKEKRRNLGIDPYNRPKK